LQKRISLYFNGDSLAGVQGDFRPSALPVIKPATEQTVDVPKRDLDTTMWEKITGLFSDDPDTLATANSANKSANQNQPGSTDPAAPIE
jgi:outer membrane protein assembly factor BamE